MGSTFDASLLHEQRKPSIVIATALASSTSANGLSQTRHGYKRDATLPAARGLFKAGHFVCCKSGFRNFS